eukprot:m.54593 g.54593  ORF g.54593 m.54593 type:complete len:326 (-) comp15531_c0_seq2:98-1075(-)
MSSPFRQRPGTSTTVSTFIPGAARSDVSWCDASRPALPAISTVAKQQSKKLEQERQSVLAVQAAREERECGVLQVMIESTRQRLAALRLRRDEICHQNMQLHGTIHQGDSGAGQAVHSLVARYAKCQQSAQVLQAREGAEQHSQAHNMQQTLQQLEQQVAQVRRQAQAASHLVRLRQRELSDLRYHDSRGQYELEQQLVQLRARRAEQQAAHAQELQELQTETAALGSAMLQHSHSEREAIHSRATETALRLMDPTVRRQAIENIQLREDVKIKMEETEELRDRVASLEEQVRNLRQQYQQMSRSKARSAPLAHTLRAATSQLHA